MSENDKYHEQRETTAPDTNSNISTSSDNSSGDKQIQILARYRGPGPGKYLLPSSIGVDGKDLTRPKAPAYSFGSRIWASNSKGPGPKYSIDSTLTNRGKENKAGISFLGRPKDPKITDYDIPGPGAYSPKYAAPRERRAPMFTIRKRTNQRNVDETPSPNRYSLPPIIGDRVPHQKRSTAATIYGRNDFLNYSQDYAQTPGPAGYGVGSISSTRKCPPVYSLHDRTHLPQMKENFPGPGAYNPQNVRLHMKSSPRFAIGVRHSEFVTPFVSLTDVII